MPDKNTLPESEWIEKRGMSPRVAPPKVESSRKPPGVGQAAAKPAEPEAGAEAGVSPAAASSEDSA